MTPKGVSNAMIAENYKWVTSGIAAFASDQSKIFEATTQR